ncbi:hypothetical protein ACOME3_000487 [Neoechinorhynchus agilis]
MPSSSHESNLSSSVNLNTTPSPNRESSLVTVISPSLLCDSSASRLENASVDSVKDFVTVLENHLENFLKETMISRLKEAFLRSKIVKPLMDPSYTASEKTVFCLKESLHEHLERLIGEIDTRIPLDEYFEKLLKSMNPLEVCEHAEKALLEICPNLFDTVVTGGGLVDTKFDNIVLDCIKRVMSILESLSDDRLTTGLKDVSKFFGNLTCSDGEMSLIDGNQFNLSKVEMPSWVRKFAAASTVRKKLQQEHVPSFLDDVPLIGDMTVNPIDQSFAMMLNGFIGEKSAACESKKLIDMSVNELDERITGHKTNGGEQGEDCLKEITQTLSLRINENTQKIDRLAHNIDIAEKLEIVIKALQSNQKTCIHHDECIQVDVTQATMTDACIGPDYIVSSDLGTNTSPVLTRNVKLGQTPIKNKDVSINTRKSLSVNTNKESSPLRSTRTECGIQICSQGSDVKSLQDAVEKLKQDKRTMLSTMQQLHQLNKRLKNENDRYKLPSKANQ